MKRPSGHKPTPEGTFVSSQSLERIAAPLTVLHANIQLMQRRVRNGDVPDSEGLLRVLARLEKASGALTAELWALGESTSTSDAIREKMEREEAPAVHQERERDA